MESDAGTERDWVFWVCNLLILVFAFGSVVGIVAAAFGIYGMYARYAGHAEPVDMSVYRQAEFPVRGLFGVLELVGLYGIWKHQKWGVFAFGAAVILGFILSLSLDGPFPAVVTLFFAVLILWLVSLRWGQFK